MTIRIAATSVACWRSIQSFSRASGSSRRSPETAYARMGIATVDPATTTYQMTASHTRVLSRPSVPIAKPAAAQMKSTLGLTTVRTAASAGRTGRGELAHALHPARGVRGTLAGEPAVEAEHDQRRADHDAQPRRPTRRLVVQTPPRGGHLDEDRRQHREPDQPAGQKSQARRPGSRRVQHQHRRDDRQRRQRDDQRQRNEFGQHRSPISPTSLPFRRIEENVASGRPPWWRYLPLSG